jgi:hypothetical protein
MFYAGAVTWDGKNGRPAHRGPQCTCLEPADFAADTGKGPRGRSKAMPPNPEPDEGLLLPDTPLCGTVRAQAWHFVHPLVPVAVPVCFLAGHAGPWHLQGTVTASGPGLTD